VLCSLPSGQCRPGREPERHRPKFAGHYPAARAQCRFSRAAGGVLTGPRPAPAAGLGRAGWPGDSDYAPRRSRGPGAGDGRGQSGAARAMCKGP
jgi:hypothetical protein